MTIPDDLFDAIRAKVRQDNRVINKAVCLAVGVNLDGHKEVLGMRIAETGGGEFWLQFVTELTNRGVRISSSPASMD